MIHNETEVVSFVVESIGLINDILMVFFVVVLNLVLITYAVWIVYLIRVMLKSKRYRAEEYAETGKEASITNLSMSGDKGKFLLLILTCEVWALVFYQLAAVFGYFLQRVPKLRVVGLHIDNTCSSEIGFKPFWLSEFQFPEVSFCLCVGRASLLIGITLCNSFIQFVSNSYVTQSWKYKNIMRPVWIVFPLTIFIIIFGTIPQTTIFVWTVNIIIFLALYFIFLRSATFLIKVLRWRERDLEYYDEHNYLKKHKKIVRNFKSVNLMHLTGMGLLILQDILAQTEIVVSLFLYYGQCFFPSIYGITYTAPIQHYNLVDFRLGLVVANLTQRIVLISATCFLLLPQLIFTVLFPVYYFIRERIGVDKRNIRFHVIRTPLLPN